MNNTCPIAEYTEAAILPGPTGKIFSVVPGTSYYVVAASHPRFTIAINEGKKLSGSLSRGWDFQSGFLVQRIHVFNEDPSLPLSITIAVGNKVVPLDNLFNVYQNEVVPQIRDDTPSVIGEAVSTVGVAGAVTGAWIKLLDADDLRAEVRLYSDAAAAAYWSPNNALDQGFSRNIVITGGLEGCVTLKTKSAIWVWHTEAGKSIRAVTFGF